MLVRYPPSRPTIEYTTKCCTPPFPACIPWASGISVFLVCIQPSSTKFDLSSSCLDSDFQQSGAVISDWTSPILHCNWWHPSIAGPYGGRYRVVQLFSVNIRGRGPRSQWSFCRLLAPWTWTIRKCPMSSRISGFHIYVNRKVTYAVMLGMHT